MLSPFPTNSLQSLKGENLAHFMVSTLHLYPPEALAVMLDGGLDFALQDLEGYTPLMHAAYIGSVSGMTTLLGLSALLGRDIALGFGCTDTDRRNVLHLTVAHNTTEARLHSSTTVELLLAHPDMDEETANAGDVDNKTPLHLAFPCGNGNCASAFLRSPKVLRGHADIGGNTPLHFLFLYPRYLRVLGVQDQFMPIYVKELLWKLLRWKAANGDDPAIDVFATNEFGYTALDLANKLGDEFLGIQCTLDYVMHGRRKRMRS